MTMDTSDSIEIKHLGEDLKEVKTKVENLEVIVGDIRYKGGITETQVTTLFQVLKDIKESISALSIKMTTIENKPNVLLEKVAVGVVTAVVMLIISMALRYKGVM